MESEEKRQKSFGTFDVEDSTESSPPTVTFDKKKIVQVLFWTAFFTILIVIFAYGVRGEYDYYVTEHIPISILVDNYTIRVNTSNQTLINTNNPLTNYSVITTFDYISTRINITECTIDQSKYVDNTTLRRFLDDQKLNMITDINTNLQDKLKPSLENINKQENDLIVCGKDKELIQKDIETLRTNIQEKEAQIEEYKQKESENQTWDLVKWGLIIALVFLLVTDGGRSIDSLKFWR
jgi:hypothetical protein